VIWLLRGGHFRHLDGAWRVLPDIPYSHVCLTMPGVLWPLFRRSRHLLHDLCVQARLRHIAGREPVARLKARLNAASGFVSGASRHSLDALGVFSQHLPGSWHSPIG
jgi:hypothetical protein